MAQICGTVTGKTMAEVRSARDAAVSAGADIVEVRLDGVDRPDPAAALDGRLRPVIVTCRPTWEGGAFDGSEEERHRLLVDAMTAGAEFVDVELRAATALEIVRMRRGRGVIVSSHRFDASDGDLDLPAQFRALRSTGAEIVKLAVSVDSLAATVPLFELGASAGRDQADGLGHLLIAMGPRGAHTRVLAGRLRNRWTYAGDGVAPGQMPAAQLLGDFAFRRIRPDAALYGVVGSPIAHSLSPAMHNAGFADAGFDSVYVALDAKDAGDFVTFAQAMNMRGASITAPFKVDLFKHADDCDPLARDVGAVNTLLMRDGKWTGSNTDVDGLLHPLAERIGLSGRRAAVLGAGGAARAAAVGLNQAGARVRICARRAEQAVTLAAALGVEVGAFPPPPGSWDVLVNTVPYVAGQKHSPVADVPLDGRIVFDLTYAPAVTPLIAQARDAGIETIGGLEMLTRQAEKQFETWTGALPPAGLFKRAAEAARARNTGVPS